MKVPMPFWIGLMFLAFIGIGLFATTFQDGSAPVVESKKMIGASLWVSVGLYVFLILFVVWFALFGNRKPKKLCSWCGRRLDRVKQPCGHCRHYGFVSGGTASWGEK